MSCKRKSVYCISLKTRFWWSFSKVIEASEYPKRVCTSSTHSSASIACIPFLLSNPCSLPHLPYWFSLSPSFLLTNENCFRTMLRQRLNSTRLGIHSQISTVWIHLLSYCRLTWRNTDIITHWFGWMLVAIGIQSAIHFSAEILDMLWG